MKQNKERAIAVVDIDGTIARMGDRARILDTYPIDWDKFYADPFNDEPIKNVCYFVKLLHKECDIIFCTSRSEKVRQKTQSWLKKHLDMDPSDYGLIMRPTNDERPDYISKIDCFFNETTDEERSRVRFVIEDSLTVAWHWRQKGFTTYQVS